MKRMSSLDIYAITKELQGLIGYRIDNIYRNITDTFFLFKLKGKGLYKNPFLLIEPGIRLHLTEIKHSVPERPSDKIITLRSHLKGTEVIKIHQIDRLVEISLKGKQDYRLYIEILNRPNFVVVGDQNRIIAALWYKKMRHRDIIPGKEFNLPPVRKLILEMTFEEIKQLISEVGDEEVVRTLVRNTGGGGELMEEILARANIPKNKKNYDIDDDEINRICSAIEEILQDLKVLKPSITINSDEAPISFQPIDLKSVSEKVKHFDTFSLALDSYYSEISPKVSMELKHVDKKSKKLHKILKAQKESVQLFEKKKKHYKELGDKIYLHLNEIDELLSTIVTARRKKIDWSVIQDKLAEAKIQGIESTKIFEGVNPEQGIIRINLDSEIIEVDFRKSVTEIANDYYQRSKKAARKIEPAKEAILETEKKIDLITNSISEQRKMDEVLLKRRKRDWYEKYHWTKTTNGFLIIGGKDIASNEEIVKRRMNDNDLFFHAELHGSPYTVLISNSSQKNTTDQDINAAALLAAVFSSGWKAGYGAVDVYYVPATNASFTAQSGEFIPKGGIMVRGKRSYIKNVEMVLTIGVQINEFNAKVIYGSKEDIKTLSPNIVIIKPGLESKGKVAKQLLRFFVKNAKSSEEKAKIQDIDLNEFVQAIPHDSMIATVEYGVNNS